MPAELSPDLLRSPAHPRALGMPMAATAVRASRPVPGLARALRVGVVHQGRILEERILPTGRPITVGASARASLLLPDVTLERATIFAPHSGGLSLELLPGLRGKVDLGEGVRTFEALRGSHGKRVLLPPEARGKVQIEDYTLLFQLVAPPPRPARSTQTGGWTWTDVDWVFLALVVVSALVHAAMVTWIQSQPPPSQIALRPHIYDHPAIYLAPAPVPPEPPAPPPEEDIAADPTASRPAADPAPAEGDEPASDEPTSDEPASDEPTSDEPIAPSPSLVDRARELGLVGTLHNSDNPAIADLIADGSGLDPEVGDAIRDSPTRVAMREPPPFLRGPAHMDDGVASNGEIEGVGGCPSCPAPSRTAQKKPLAPKLQETLPAPQPDSDFDLGPWLKRARPGFKACYERALKGDPDLAGRVVLGLATDGTGRVADAYVEADSMGSAAVNACLLKELRRLPLPPEAADLEVQGYGLMFTPQ